MVNKMAEGTPSRTGLRTGSTREGLFLVAVLSIAAAAGCCDEKALPRAIAALQSDSAAERNKALHVVGRCGERSERAVPVIAGLMYDRNVGVASSAAYALRRIDTPSARAALKAAEDARARKSR